MILFNALRNRFPAEGYALFQEVRNGTGYGRKERYADAIAMSLWPSRGLELLGFEFKTSRSDWQRELKDPSKAEAICQFCERWWIVVSDAKIVKPDELPKTWGLLALKDDKLVQIVDAPKLNPMPIPRTFMASLFRAAQNAIPKAQVDEAALAVQRKRYNDSIESLNTSHKTALAYAQRQLEMKNHTIQQFKTHSGIDIEGDYSSLYRRDVGKIGEAVRFVLDGGLKHAYDELAALHKAASDLTEDLSKRLVAIKEAEKTRNQKELFT